MDRNVGVLVGVAVAAILALVAFAAYRRLQRGRTDRVRRWVSGYLSERFSRPLDRLSINCSDDVLWPVLVTFGDPRTGTRHTLQFACGWRDSTFALSSEKEERQWAAGRDEPATGAGGGAS